MVLTKSEKLILKAMYQEYRPMAIMEISKRSKVSWITVKKYIPRLLRKKYITQKKEGKRMYYKFNYNKVKL